MAVEEDYMTAVASGNIIGVKSVNKFGAALDCDSTKPTDVWDGADGTTSTIIWVPPTQARVHNLVSTQAADAAAGTGARTIQVYGLKTWETPESSEIVTLNGASNVATANSYVIIHRMKCLTFGSGQQNAGIITATAATDATVTAAIQAGEGQTLMAIYGVPHEQELRIYQAYAEITRKTGTPEADIRLFLMENADQADAGWVSKDLGEMAVTESYLRNFMFPKRYAGPCIVKMQVTTNTNNTVCYAGFSATVATNTFKDDY